jgi:ADP-ribosylglycohydrolase/fructose-1,6-bisphosphatase/inositol monophosphatase family enzyme
MDLERALDVALAAAAEAGRILRADFHRAGGPRGKVDKAVADVEAEEAIRGRLAAAFPRWAYLGEETGRIDGEPGAPIWLVDPNDGTRDYLKGRRGSAVSIGLIADRKPVLGVVYAFAYPDDEGDLFAWAEGGGPLRRNGRPTSSRLPVALGPTDVVLVSSKGYRDADRNLECATPARFRAVPSIAHRLALVAAGEAAAASSLYAPGAWDYAAGQALLRSVDAVLVDENGEEVRYAADGTSQTLRAFAGARAVAVELARRPWDKVRDGRRADVYEPAQLIPGATVADSRRLARAQGCLLGQVAGDSLGSLVEFQASAAVQARYPDGPRLLEDGGVWGTLAGQPTDDSEMALALARSIVDSGGYDPQRALAAYREWYRSVPFDIGATNRAALVGYLMRESAANGSLMRASPLGILAHRADPDRVAASARDDSSLTHPNPVCLDAVAAYVVAIAHAVAHGDGPEAAYRAALDWARRDGADASVVERLERARDQPPPCDGESQGWVLVALQNAFYELLHAPSLEEGVVATVRRGGDTDTNAAIAGALLGAVHGRDAVPSQWRQMILSCRAHPVKARHPRPPAYWPVDVLELAERLLLAGAAPPVRIS